MEYTQSCVKEVSEGVNGTIEGNGIWKSEGITRHFKTVLYTHTHIHTYIHTQGVSRLVDISAGGDFLGLCEQKSSYKHVSDFGWLRSYDCVGNDLA
jgi:hypothetical protein